MMTEHDSRALQGSTECGITRRRFSARGRTFGFRGFGLRLACILIATVALGVSISGCNGDNSQRRMAESSGEFTKGYEDGRRDALNSWTDLHGGWMWLWMTDRQYQEGYDRGWSDGRSEKKLRDKQKNQEAEQSNSKGLFGSDD